MYTQVLLIPIGTYCAVKVADLLLFCYEKDTIISLSDDAQADIIHALNTAFRNLDNTYVDYMVSLYAADTSDTKVSFWDLNLSILNDIVSTKFT